MAAENVLATQVTLGLLGSGVLQLLKKSTFMAFVNDNSKVFNHLFLLATSAAGAVGIHTAWNGANHSLVITGLDAVTIFTSLWIWAKQWAIQFLVHRGAFGAVATPASGAPVSNQTFASATAVSGIKPLARSSLSWGGHRKLLGATLAVWACFLLMALALVFAGCAARNVTVGQVNQSVTMVIADAGTVAISAEQSYQAGKIPQTPAARTAINDLGAAYEEAKRLFSLALIAEGGYNASEGAQITACQPASSQGGVVPDPARCAAATQAATAAKAGMDNAQVNLSTSLQALTAKTAAVKAIAPAN